MPSRKDFGNSVFSSLEVFSIEWHKNNNILACICKSSDKTPNWTIRIFEFDTKRINYRSATMNLKSDHPYYNMNVKWMGNDLFVVPKYRDSNLDTLNVYPYKLNKTSLSLEPWSSDKVLKSLKYSDFIQSSDGVHFLLANLDRKKLVLLFN